MQSQDKVDGIIKTYEELYIHNYLIHIMKFIIALIQKKIMQFLIGLIIL